MARLPGRSAPLDIREADRPVSGAMGLYRARGEALAAVRAATRLRMTQMPEMRLRSGTIVTQGRYSLLENSACYVSQWLAERVAATCNALVTQYGLERIGLRRDYTWLDVVYLHDRANAPARESGAA